MKVVLFLSLILSISAWGMEEKKEKEANLFPIGSLVLNVDNNMFSGEDLDEINHFAGEFGAHYTGIYRMAQNKIIELQDKINSKFLLESGEENTRRYYASKLAYWKDKLAKYERLKEDFSSLPEILRKVLLITLRCPEYLESNTITHINKDETEVFRYFSLKDPRDYFFSKDSYRPLLDKHYSLLSDQLELNKINCPQIDRMIWNRIMETFGHFICKQININKIQNFDDPELYRVFRDLSKLLPKHLLESLGPKEAFRSDIIERREIELTNNQDFTRQMVNLYNKINDFLKTFIKDVKEFYKNLPQESK